MITLGLLLFLLGWLLLGFLARQVEYSYFSLKWPTFKEGLDPILGFLVFMSGPFAVILSYSHFKWLRENKLPVVFFWQKELMSTLRDQEYEKYHQGAPYMPKTRQEYEEKFNN